MPFFGHEKIETNLKKKSRFVDLKLRNFILSLEICHRAVKVMDQCCDLLTASDKTLLLSPCVKQDSRTRV